MAHGNWPCFILFDFFIFKFLVFMITDNVTLDKAYRSLHSRHYASYGGLTIHHVSAVDVFILCFLILRYIG